MKNQFLKGKKIYLRDLEEEDLPNIQNWLNDSEFTRYLFQGDRPSNLQIMKEDFNKNLKNRNEIAFAIITSNNVHVGWAGIYEINWISRKGELRFFIGERKFWKKGYAAEVVTLLVGYGFNKLNLHRVYGGTNIENKGSIKVFRNNGFFEEGILKEEHFRNGRYYDVIRFGLLNKRHLKGKTSY